MSLSQFRWSKFPKTILLSCLGLVMATAYMVSNSQPDPKVHPVRPPAEKPFSKSLAGTGIIEALDDNIAVAPLRKGRVSEVFVEEGDWVNKGDPLYQLDTRELSAKMQTLAAQVGVQEAALSRLKQEPRTEDVPPAEAAVQRAQKHLDDMSTQLKRLQGVGDPRAISADQLSKQTFAVEKAQADLDQAKANLQKIKAGVWTPDLKRSQAELAVYRAQLQELKTQLALAVAEAPVDGEVLQVNVHPGESVSDTPTTPPVVLGNTQRLQVRVDIDEINASHVKDHMPGRAYLKGNARRNFPIEFVRIEPYMVPKKNLTGRTEERVDVRVLQLIYQFKKPEFPVFVGQQVDVFLEK